jgi:hypothetical protein
LINDVANGVYYARLVMDMDGRHIEVDSRPSDAIALAVRINVPIFVDERVLERAVVDLGAQGIGESGGGASGAGRQAGHPELETTERVPEEQLAAFREVIEHLNLDDLGRPNA